MLAHIVNLKWIYQHYQWYKHNSFWMCGAKLVVQWHIHYIDEILQITFECTNPCNEHEVKLYWTDL